MNKNLKKIVAIALAFSAFSAIAPVGSSNILTTKAYASSDDDENDKSLSKLKLETSGGSSIQLYSENDYKSSHKVDDDEISDGDKYYAKTSSSKISLSTSGPKSKFVRVFTSTSSSAKGKKISSDISLSSGTNTIVVRVYGSEPDSSIKYNEKDDVKYEYTLKVKYTGSSSSSDDDDDDSSSQDSIYLSSLTLSEGSIDFAKKTSSYNVTVGSSVDEVTIKAKPEDSDYTVTIDGSSVDEDDNWKRDVSLEKGKNKIKIEVEDDDDNKRTYTLNITRGTSSSTSDSTSSTSDKIFLDSLSVGATSLTLSEDVSAYNLRVKSSVEKIQLKAEPKNDNYTVTIDGTTVDDSDSYKKNVSLDEDTVKTFKIKVKNSSGTEKVYTLNIGRGDVDASKFPNISTSNTTTNNNTQTNTNTNINTAVKANQWVEVSGGQWQYNDATGNPIKNQWFYDRSAGKTYYLQADGTMATGWLQLQGTWYYLNPVSDGTRGAKMTGWQNVGGTWYYMDSEGKMLSNTTVDGYKLAANGAWIR